MIFRTMCDVWFMLYVTLLICYRLLAVIDQSYRPSHAVHLGSTYAVGDRCANVESTYIRASSLSLSYLSSSHTSQVLR